MSDGRSFFVPEVLQTSLMDCGPAALKAVCQGLGRDVHYEWLRDRCETDVDGTSIDSLARLGAELGLVTAEMVVPHDSFLLPEARCLPAIVIKRAVAGGLHFVVAWRTVGPYLQILDPGSGRHWVRKRSFLEDMPHFPIPLTVARFRRWAGSSDASDPVRRKLIDLGIPAGRCDDFLGSITSEAGGDPDWQRWAALDAGIRMVTTLVRNGALVRGPGCAALLQDLLDRVGQESYAAIPKGFWWAQPGKTPDKIVVNGPVIVHFGKASSLPVTAASPTATPGVRRKTPPPPPAPPPPRLNIDLPEAIKAELSLPSPSPSRLLTSLIRIEARGTLALIGTAIVATAAVAALDVVILHELPSAILRRLSLPEQRAAAVLLVVAFAAAALGLELALAGGVSRISRAVELRVRAALLQKLPRLEDRYLRSRPTSDMTARGHALHMLREAPPLLARIARSGLLFAATLAGILWLAPAHRWLTVVAALVALGAPFAIRRSMVETLMRLRTHTASLERFYLDALIGVVPIRAHGAERAVRREHEGLLVEWAHTARQVHGQTTAVQALQGIAGTTAAIVIVGGYVVGKGPVTGLLLLVFWALRLPVVAQDLAMALVGWRNVRNVAVRLFAPLGANEVDLPDEVPVTEPGGVGLALHDVTVKAGGHRILSDVTLDIPAGSHVAIVGASGAGKSSLLSLLLGFARASGGEVLVDGQPLDDEALGLLRQATAWVDPAVQIWNRTLFDNVAYGSMGDVMPRLPAVVAAADLTELLETLPAGWQSSLGEGGGAVSGGQGQRVRLARGLMRPDARLVLLDEPFRGLERERRRALMERARQVWDAATLLFVSHDVADTASFDRVLVVDGGRIVEDGAPAALLADSSSRYHALAKADREARIHVWSEARWRRVPIIGGAVAASHDLPQEVAS